MRSNWMEGLFAFEKTMTKEKRKELAKEARKVLSAREQRREERKADLASGEEGDSDMQAR